MQTKFSVCKVAIDKIKSDFYLNPVYILSVLISLIFHIVYFEMQKNDLNNYLYSHSLFLIGIVLIFYVSCLFNKSYIEASACALIVTLWSLLECFFIIFTEKESFLEKHIADYLSIKSPRSLAFTFLFLLLFSLIGSATYSLCIIKKKKQECIDKISNVYLNISPSKIEGISCDNTYFEIAISDIRQIYTCSEIDKKSLSNFRIYAKDKTIDLCIENPLDAKKALLNLIEK